MKKSTLLFSLNLLLCFIFLKFESSAQTTVPAGNVSGTWNLAGSPYLIQGDITIPNGLTLTINPGVTINFQGHYKFLVAGRILAIGTAADTIRFTAATPATGWWGLRFDNTLATNDTSKIYFCKMQYGRATGTTPDNYGGAIYVRNFSKLKILNSFIANCSSVNGRGAGIYCENSDILISKNTITSNIMSGPVATSAAGGICNTGGSPIITFNTIL